MVVSLFFPLPLSFAMLIDILSQRRDVVSALHATEKSSSWTECQGTVYSSFELKTSPAAVTLLPSILDQIPVMLFAGDQDFICNYMGIEKLIGNLEWKGAKGMQVSRSKCKIS